MPGNKSSGNRVGGSVNMSTDSGKGNVAENNIIAKDLVMKDRKSDRLTIFGHSATGTIAIAAIVVILVVSFIFA